MSIVRGSVGIMVYLRIGGVGRGMRDMGRGMRGLGWGGGVRMDIRRGGEGRTWVGINMVGRNGDYREVAAWVGLLRN